MREREYLLAAICDAPEDDAPRLVFADFLEDHGELARAKFIRLQIRLAKMMEDDPEWPALKQREDQLWEEHHEAWHLELPKWPGVSMEHRFTRGFLESVSTTAAAFLRYGPRLAKQLPLSDLQLEKLKSAQCVQVAESPALGKVRKLSLYDNKIGNQGVRPFLQTRQLSQLKCLDLVSTGIDGKLMKALCDAPYLKQLEELELSGNTLYEAGIAQLAEAQGWNSLRKFKGYSMGLSAEAACFFSDAPIFAHLEVLELSQNWLGDRGVVRLVQGKRATWHVLDLGQNEIGDEGASALAGSPRLKKVRELELRDNQIGTHGVCTLAKSPHLRELRVLDLWGGNQFGDAGVEAIAKSRYLKRLTQLSLDGGGFSLKGMKALANSPHLSELQSLHLNDNPIGVKGARALAASKYLTKLRSLMICNCDIGDEGCCALMQSPNIANLTGLWLDNNGLTDIGAQAVLDTPYLRHLKEDLTLDDDDISDAMVLKLRQRYGRILFFYRPSLGKILD